MGRIEKDKLADFKGIDEGFKSIAESIKKVTEALTEMKGVAKGDKSMLSLAQTSEKVSKETEQYKKSLKELNALTLKLHNALNKEKAQREKQFNAMSLRLHQKLAKDKENVTKQANIKEKADAKKLLDTKTALGKQQSREYLQQLAREEAARKKALKSFGTGAKKVSGLTRSFRNLTMSLRNLAVAYLGFQTLMRGFQDIFKVTKILDSITFAQEKVIKSQVEFAQTQDWLSEIISDYGLDLVTVTNRYTKFRAATISSNLTAIETQKIFGSMSKAAATLGLKTDELQGVYLALEQMISKNKVTTEELRRQLGERLPGAFDIMAKSMGVSTNKLNEMLRAGEVMSEEVLPAFAVAVEEAYGIRSVQFVDTLVGAQNRLRTAWIELIKILSAGDSFKGFLNSMSSAVGWIGENITLITKLGKSVINLGLIYLGFATYMKVARSAAVVYMVTVRGITVAQAAMTVATLTARNAFIALRTAIMTNPIGLAITAFTTLVAVLLPFVLGTKKATKETKAFSESLAEETNKIDLLFGSLKTATQGTEEWNYAKQQINSTYGKYIQNLIDEKTTLEEINEIQEEVNKQALGRMLLMQRDVEIQNANKKANEANANSYVRLKDILEDLGFSGDESGVKLAELKDIINELSDGSIGYTDATNKLLGGIDKSKVGTVKYSDAFIELKSILQDVTSTSKEATAEVERAGQVYDAAAGKLKFITPPEQFDIFKKGLKDAANAYQLYSEAKTDSEREFLRNVFDSITKGDETYEQHLKSRLKNVGNFVDKAKFIEAELERLKFEDWQEKIEDRGEELDKYTKFSSDQSKIEWENNNDVWAKGARTFKEYLELRLKDTEINIRQRQILEELLFDTQKKNTKKSTNEALKNQEQRDKASIQLLRQAQEIALADKIKQGASEKDIDLLIFEQKRDLINFEIKLNEDRKNNFTKTEKEKLDIEAKNAKLKADILESTTDFESSEANRISDEKQDLAEREQARLQTEANTDILIIQEQFAKEIGLLNQQYKDKELSDRQYAEERLKLEKKLQDDIIAIQIANLKRQLLLDDLDVKQKEQIDNQIIALEQQKADNTVAIDDTTTQKVKDNQKEIEQLKIQLANEFFEFGNAMFNNRLQRLEEQKNWEVALAGNSLEDRLIAERKFDKESAKLKKQQAIADKAQAAFNIIVNTASAIMKAAPLIPLQILMASIGALQLATVLAQPIPQFFEGGETSGGLAIVGEDKGSKKGGSELITLPSGDSFLSPDSATLMDLPSGTHIDSHSETQRILANATTKTAYEGVSMSRSEGYLKEIRDKGTIERKDGYKIVTRKGFYGKYRTN